MIRDENGMLAGYVYLDIAGRDVGKYVTDANRALQKLHLPAGYTFAWGGQSESMARANRRLAVVVPITLAIVILLIYLNTRSFTKSMIIMLAVPFLGRGRSVVSLSAPLQHQRGRVGRSDRVVEH